MTGKTFCVCLGLTLLIAYTPNLQRWSVVPAFGEGGADGYLVGGPSENFQPGNLDLQRAPQGTFPEDTSSPNLIRQPRKSKQADTSAVIKSVPTVAELDAAKAKATAETAMEVSKKAEEVANQSKEESAQSKTTSEKAIESANNAISKANESIDQANRSIDRVNEVNQQMNEDLARTRFNLEKKDQQIEKDVTTLKEEVEKLKIKPPEFYLVKKGDFLIKIAGKEGVYGESQDWKKIYRANRGKIKDPNFIYPGQKLIIPREQK
ncbi:MAG: LysM peptidoglycan-binding domain-containing protein [Candidatus Omnitrophota bacterium]